MTKAKDELTTQSDNTLDDLVLALYYTGFVDGQNYSEDGKIDEAYIDKTKAALTKWRDDAIAAQNLALLDRLEKQLPEKNGAAKISLAWMYETIQSERALIEKRMM